MEHSETRYVRTSDGVELAYRVVGDGPVDLFWSFYQLSDVEAIFDYPPIREYLDALGRFARVVVHDRRGMGRSSGERGDLETDIGDLNTLLEGIGAQRAYLAGAVGGGAIYAAFAARHPDRVSGVVWYGAFAQSLQTPDYPWGSTADELEEYAQGLDEGWGTEQFAERFVSGGAPSRAGDREAVSFFARWMRGTSDARSAAAYNRAWDKLDLHLLLGSVRVPTLILDRAGDADEAAYVAARIPQAKLVTLEGSDFMPFYDSGPVVAAIRDFVEKR